MEWTRTRSVLAELGNLLTCAICKSYLKDPCTLENCDHNFCRKCIEESLGSESKCPECGSFSWLKDLRLNHQLATTVSMTKKLQSLIGINMEVENVEPQVQDNSESSDKTFTFASDEEMPDENYDEKIVTDESHNEQEESSCDTESVSASRPGSNTKECEKVRKTRQTISMSESRTSLTESNSLENNTKTAETRNTVNLKQNTNESKETRKHSKTRKKPNNKIYADTRESDSEEHHAITLKATNRKQRNVKTSTRTKHNIRLQQEASVSESHTDTESESNQVSIPQSITASTNEKENVITKPKRITKLPSVTLDKDIEDTTTEYDSEEDSLEQDWTGRKPALIRRKKKMSKPLIERVQSSLESDSEADNIRTATTNKKRHRNVRKSATVGRSKKMNKRERDMSLSATELSESDVKHESTSGTKKEGATFITQHTGTRKSARGYNHVSEEARVTVQKHIADSGKESNGELQVNSGKAETANGNEILKRHGGVRKLPSIKRIKKTTRPRSSATKNANVNNIESENETNHKPHTGTAMSTEGKSKHVKLRSRVRKSTTATERITDTESNKSDTAEKSNTSLKENLVENQSITATKHNTMNKQSCSVLSSTADSQSETEEETTNAKQRSDTRKSARGDNKLRASTAETPSDSEENNVNTTKEKSTKDYGNIKQHRNHRKSHPVKGRKISIKRHTLTEEESDTESMEIEEVTTHKQNPAAAVQRSKNNIDNSCEQESGTKVKQRKRNVSKREPTKITETTTVEQIVKSSVQGLSHANGGDPTGMQKSKFSKNTAKNTSGTKPSAQRPSKRADQSKIVAQKKNESSERSCQNASHKNSRKNYSLRHKPNPTSNLIEVPFDFTQQEDPFHFTFTPEDDNNCSDENNHDNDHGSDLDDLSDHNDSHSDNEVDHDNDVNGHVNDCDDHDKSDVRNESQRLSSKSSKITSTHARKTRGEKSDINHNDTGNGMPHNTKSAKVRLRNDQAKVQFTKLKDRPSNCDTTNQPENGNIKGAQTSMVVNEEDKENVTLNTKRRHVRGKRHNIRQYLIAVDPTDMPEISSDDAPAPQKRKKSRNSSTSSISQSSRNTVPSSQSSQNVAGSSQKTRNRKGETPLHIAAIKGDLVLAQKLINEGADPNVKDHAGWTPLHEACNHGHVDIVKLFLDNDALINIPGCDNDTPLHDAVANGRLKVVKLLVARGAVLTARNKQGLLPMDYAVTKKMKAALTLRGESSRTKSAEMIENIKKSSEVCRESQVILGTTLKIEDQFTLKKCVRQLGGTLVHEFHESVTHVVTSVNEDGHCPRTMKYLSGILAGKWIVSFDWINDSLRQRQWLDEDVYEVEGTAGKTCNAARKARLNILQQMPRLFDGCSFFLRGVFKPPTPSKQDLITLIQLGGGKLLQREPKVKDEDLMSLPSSPIVTSLSRAPEVAYHAPANSTLSCCTEFILYDPVSCDQPKVVYSPVLRTAPVTWLMDCISSFQLLDIPDV